MRGSHIDHPASGVATSRAASVLRCLGRLHCCLWLLPARSPAPAALPGPHPDWSASCTQRSAVPLACRAPKKLAPKPQKLDQRVCVHHGALQGSSRWSKTPISPWQTAEWDLPTDPVLFCLQKQVVQPLNGDPFIGMLETPVTSAPIVANYLSNLPVYRTGVSPLLRGVEIGLAHGFLLTGPFIKVRTCLWQEQVCE